MSGARALFVTGAGTGIGKTFVTAGLARARRAGGGAVTVLKPVLSGWDADDPTSDAAVLAEAAGLDPASPGVVGRIAPWRFAAPLSPDMAALREGRAVPFDDLVAFCRLTIDAAAADTLVLIEGIGGAMVPLDERRTVRDWVASLGIPAILVGGTHLGAISHVLSAQAALAAAAVPLTAIVLSESEANPVPPAETRNAVARHAGGVPVRLVRRGGGGAPDLARLAASLDGG